MNDVNILECCNAIYYFLLQRTNNAYCKMMLTLGKKENLDFLQCESLYALAKFTEFINDKYQFYKSHGIFGYDFFATGKSIIFYQNIIKIINRNKNIDQIINI